MVYNFVGRPATHFGGPVVERELTAIAGALTLYSQNQCGARSSFAVRVNMKGPRLLLALLLTGSCTAHNPVAPSDLSDAEALVRFLEHDGARATVAEQMPREAFPFFSVNSRRLVVNGETVHVFVYPSPGAAGEDAALVAPSGSPIGATQVTWEAPPRFYMKGQLLVLYVGRNDGVSALLEGILGPPFAGRR